MLIMLVRVAGMLLVCAGSFIVLTDCRLLADGRPEATVLGALVGIHQWAGHPTWVAVTAWLLPLVMGVIFLVTPRLHKSLATHRQ